MLKIGPSTFLEDEDEGEDSMYRIGVQKVDHYFSQINIGWSESTWTLYSITKCLDLARLLSFITQFFFCGKQH